MNDQGSLRGLKLDPSETILIKEKKKVNFQVTPIAIAHTDNQQQKGTPIQPKFAQGVKGIIEVDQEYEAGLKDLDGFERIWVVYWLHKAREYSLEVTPYKDVVKRGLFSTRAPMRPNPIGISSVKLEKVEGNRLFVSEVDLLDGTPVLDIKPYSKQFDCFETERNGWLDSSEVKTNSADERFVEGK